MKKLAIGVILLVGMSLEMSFVPLASANDTLPANPAISPQDAAALNGALEGLRQRLIQVQGTRQDVIQPVAISQRDAENLALALNALRNLLAGLEARLSDGGQPFTDTVAIAGGLRGIMTGLLAINATIAGRDLALAPMHTPVKAPIPLNKKVMPELKSMTERSAMVPVSKPMVPARYPREKEMASAASAAGASGNRFPWAVATVVLAVAAIGIWIARVRIFSRSKAQEEETIPFPAEVQPHTSEDSFTGQSAF